MPSPTNLGCRLCASHRLWILTCMWPGNGIVAKTLWNDWLCVLPYFSSLLITTITNVSPPCWYFLTSLSSLALKFCWVYHKKKNLLKLYKQKRLAQIQWRLPITTTTNVFQPFPFLPSFLCSPCTKSLAKFTSKKKAKQFFKFCKLKTFGTWNPMD